MSDVLMPLNLRHARTTTRYLDSSGISRGMFGGQTIVAARGGDRLALTLEMTKHGGRTAEGLAERAQLRSWLASLRGRQNAVYAIDKSARRRGSFPTGELLANNNFTDGTTGWTTSGEYAHTVSEGVLRATRTAMTANQFALWRSANVTVTQYAPYAIRFCVQPGRGSYDTNGFTVDDSANSVTGSIYTNYGLLTQAMVPSTTNIRPALNDRVTSSYLAGDYLNFTYASLSRCALVDVRPNYLVRSDEIDNASWSKTNITVSAGTGTAPDGTSSADFLTENTSNAFHSVSQSVTVSASAQDYALCVPVAASNRSFCFLEMSDGTTFVNQYFALGAGGSVGATGSTGASWANRRAFTVNLGGGWVLCCLVARKTGSSTSLSVTIGGATADGTGSYVGTSVTSIAVWRATLAASSVPGAIRGTTAAAVPIGFPPTGSALNLKGLPASTNGLLEVDDQVEIVTARGSELKVITARLNSDAAGRGYLQFEPPLRTSPTDNAPVIIHQPMGRWLFSGDAVGWDNDPGVWSTASAEFEEA